MMQNFVVCFSTLEDYNGEFGFDEARIADMDYIPNVYVQKNNAAYLEYIYNDFKNKYILVRANKKLQTRILEEYSKYTIDNEYNYYLPHLNMFPDQEIELQMKIILLNDIDISTEVITVEKNDAYLVTIDGQTNENIQYIPDGKPKEMSIKCIKPSKSSYIKLKDTKNNIVGQIQTKDNRTSYPLHVRVICVTQDTPNKDSEIEQLIEQFKENRIEEYLNKNSLNQALIKTKIEIDKKYHITFNETFVRENLNILKNEEDEKILQLLFNNLINEYRLNFETNGEKFNGVLIFLHYIDIEHTTEYRGLTRQPNANEIIVFKPHLNHKTTYAHEIGHSLGLSHIFITKKELDIANLQSEELNTLSQRVELQQEIIYDKKSKIRNGEEHIEGDQSDIDALKASKDHDRSKVKAFIKNLEDRIELRKFKNSQHQITIQITKKQLEKDEKRCIYLEKELRELSLNRYKFKMLTTNNMMDYSSHRLMFTHWQWWILQDHLKRFNERTS